MTVEEWLGKDNKLGIDIWNKKYRYKNETLDEWFDRVSNGDEQLKKYLQQKKILLGGRAMANRGTNTDAGYFNCYSYGYVEDSYKEIMQAAMDIGLTFKGQGGQGISLSKLRPKGTPIGQEFTSDGIIPFMKIFNEVTAGTSQGGARKGALMISLDACHKEALDFIHIKSQEGLIEKANLSLEIDDEFMKAVKHYYQTGEKIILHEKRSYSGHDIEYDVDPVEVFEALVDNCYDWGDPAVLYTNRFRNFNIMQYDDEYQIETCNPCGEQPLKKNGACCLASINLSEFVKDPYTDNAHFDFCDFANAVRCGVDTLDKIIDENYMKHPLKEQQEASYNFRNIGLGVFGYATMLMKLGLKYGEDNAISFTDRLFNNMFRVAVFESSERAYELGSFPKYDPCVWDSKIIQNHFSKEEIEQFHVNGLRNCSLLSIAPTGSIATMCGESGGTEAEYAMKFTRRTVGMTDGEDTYYDVYCKAATEFMKLYDTKTLPDYFIDAQHLEWQKRVETQSVIQKHIDTAISSTVNLPNQATKEDIKNIYLTAWQKGLKGVTIFRDGCKRLGILTLNGAKEKKENDFAFDSIVPVSRKTLGTTHGNTYCRRCACGTLYITVNSDDHGNLVETFVESSKGGVCKANTAAVNRMISLAMRSGVKIEEIVDQLKGIDCQACTRVKANGKNIDGKSCPDIIASVIADYYKYVKAEEPHTLNAVVVPQNEATVCPECGSAIRNEGGCVVCPSCGWSRCG